MQGSEALALVAELEAAFSRKVGEAGKNAFVRELLDHNSEAAQAGVRSLIQTEERFPAIATTLRYVREAESSNGEELTAEQNTQGLEQVRKDVAWMARFRKEPFIESLRSHLSQCRENLTESREMSDNDPYDDQVKTWERRVEWCQELLSREAIA